MQQIEIAGATISNQETLDESVHSTYVKCQKTFPRFCNEQFYLPDVRIFGSFLNLFTKPHPLCRESELIQSDYNF